MKKNIVNISALMLAAIIFYSCNPVKNVIKDGTKDLLNNYTLNQTPNGLDTVGIIFSMDKKGKVTAVGNLLIPTNRDSIVVPKELDVNNISFGVLANFLTIKNFDSTTQVGLSDTIKVNTNFSVDKGLLTRYDVNTNLAEAFNKKSDVIAGNVKFMGLEKNNLYIIIETIKSNEVNLSNVKASHFNFDAKAKIKELLKINPDVNVSNSKNNSLVYKTNESLVIFYKLRQIFVNIPKADDPNKIELTLGPVETKQALNQNN